MNVYTVLRYLCYLWIRLLVDLKIFERITSRVDVSETFSAHQLWFRVISGLFQRYSLPENLWTALKTEIFRAKNQRWNSADFIWNRADSELNSAYFLWNRADFLLNSAETPNFQSKKISTESELFQRWFSLKESWYPLKPSETALIIPGFPLRQRWTSRDILFFFRKLLQESSDLKLSWKFRKKYSVMAKLDLVLFPQIFSR